MTGFSDGPVPGIDTHFKPPDPAPRPVLALGDDQPGREGTEGVLIQSFVMDLRPELEDHDRPSAVGPQPDRPVEPFARHIAHPQHGAGDQPGRDPIAIDDARHRDLLR